MDAPAPVSAAHTQHTYIQSMFDTDLFDLNGQKIVRSVFVAFAHVFTRSPIIGHLKIKPNRLERDGQCLADRCLPQINTESRWVFVCITSIRMWCLSFAESKCFVEKQTMRMRGKGAGCHVMDKVACLTPANAHGSHYNVRQNGAADGTAKSDGWLRPKPKASHRTSFIKSV